MVSAGKEPALVVEAFAKLRGRMNARLAIVGLLGPGERAALERIATNLGVRESVALTDFLPRDEYWRYLNSVVCAVQIRRVTNGEFSGAVGDCLAAGVPVITNIPSCLELSADVIEPVDADVTATELADRIWEVLSDPDRAKRRSAAARCYARETTFAHVGERLIEFVDRVKLRAKELTLLAATREPCGGSMDSRYD